MLASLKNTVQGMSPAMKIGVFIAVVALAWYVTKNRQDSQDMTADPEAE